jgi:hypothetical protein
MSTWFPEYVTSAETLMGAARRARRTIIRNFFIVLPDCRLPEADIKYAVGIHRVRLDANRCFFVTERDEKTNNGA